jgi:hypothetical protein
MVADARVCKECGAPISAERRLVPTSRGSWVTVTVPVGCTNPLCRNASNRRAVPPGSTTLVA